MFTLPSVSMLNSQLPLSCWKSSQCTCQYWAGGLLAGPKHQPCTSSADNDKELNQLAFCIESPLGWLREVTYRLVFAVHREKDLCKVEESKRTAHSPHINSLSDGQTESDFWSPGGGQQEQKLRLLASSKQQGTTWMFQRITQWRGMSCARHRPVSQWLHLHPLLDMGNLKGFTKVNKFYSQGLVLPVDKHDVVWLYVSVQDTNIPKDFQCHQQLQEPNKKMTSSGLCFQRAAP